MRPSNRNLILEGLYLTYEISSYVKKASQDVLDQESPKHSSRQKLPFSIQFLHVYAISKIILLIALIKASALAFITSCSMAFP